MNVLICTIDFIVACHACTHLSILTMFAGIQLHGESDEFVDFVAKNLMSVLDASTCRYHNAITEAREHDRWHDDEFIVEAADWRGDVQVFATGVTIVPAALPHAVGASIKSLQCI